MPGNANTASFLLSTATVMIGPLADLHKLNPAAHSIGLVKNFQVTGDPKFVELTQGLPGQVVMSVKTDEGLKCSMEVYEYTIRNIAYATGLDASGAGYDPITTQYVTATSSVAAAATTLKIATDLTTTFVAGTVIYLQTVDSDIVHIAKVASSAYSAPDTTVTFTGYPVPTGVTFAVGAKVGVIKRIDVGGTITTAEMSAKVVGLLPRGNKPFVILFPKIKITKGLGMSFAVDNFTNMPFEFTPYAQLASDTFYSEYGLSPMTLLPSGV